MTLDQLVKLLLEIANPLFALIGVIAVGVFGYRQWKGGKRHDEIGSAAEHIVSSADKLIDMKDDEIQKLLKRVDDLTTKSTEHDAGMATMREERSRDRIAIVSLTEEISVLKLEVRRSDDALSYLVTQVGSSFPEAVETAWRIRRGELRL